MTKVNLNDIDPALVKLMEDRIHEVYRCDHRPNEKVCDIYPRFRMIAKRMALDIETVMYS